MLVRRVFWLTTRKTGMSARIATAQEGVALRGNHNETSGWTGSVN
jgi:hypothetical protein